MPAFFREIDVFVLPSISRPNWTEQFGRVLIEAMASEVVVVGSDSGEIPHVIGEAGLVFPEGDAPALCARLEELGASEDMRSPAGAAREERACSPNSRSSTSQSRRIVSIRPCCLLRTWRSSTHVRSNRFGDSGGAEAPTTNENHIPILDCACRGIASTPKSAGETER